MSNTGIVQSTSRVQDDSGRIVLRVVIYFYDGDTPDINAETIWGGRPVTVKDDSIIQQQGQNDGNRRDK